MSAYGEFRQSFEKDESDERILFYGIRYIIETYVARKWTVEQVQQSEKFFKTHNAGKTDFPFPKDLFLKFIDENDGRFPVQIRALPEGQTIYPHVPVYQITAKGEYTSLCTWLETLMTMIWYPTTVCTLSRRAKEAIRLAFNRSVDSDHFFLLNSRLHDFGFRGCTSVEQSVIGGSAHLVNFDGSDTMSAAYYVQFHLNNGNPVATSIPATEHSIMTSWKTEKDALVNLINEYGSNLYACVMDSYDYAEALEKLLPSITKLKNEKNGFLVLRPDSGDPIETVLMALRAGEKVFGSCLNAKGFKVIKGCSVIQGDGVNLSNIKKILDATMNEGFSAENVAFGMGAGLLQKINRDTMSFATKVCHITYESGESRDIMKMPTTDSSKYSLPGCTRVTLNSDDGIPKVYPSLGDNHQNNLLEIVYDFDGSVKQWDDFETVRKRAEESWNRLPRKVVDGVLSGELKAKIESCVKERQRR